jgi:NTE family protein
MSSGHISQLGIDGCEQMRPLTVLQVAPSVNLTEVAAQHQKDMPYLIQYFVNSLGRDAASCSDLMSYLLFTPKYTRELIQLGYHDADRRIDEIEDYLFSSDDGASKGAAVASRYGKSRAAESGPRRSTSPVRPRG